MCIHQAFDNKRQAFLVGQRQEERSADGFNLCRHCGGFLITLLALSRSNEVVLEVELLNITSLPHQHKQIRPRESKSEKFVSEQQQSWCWGSLPGYGRLPPVRELRPDAGGDPKHRAPSTGMVSLPEVSSVKWILFLLL